MIFKAIIVKNESIKLEGRDQTPDPSERAALHNKQHFHQISMQKKFNFLIYGYRHSVLHILQMIVIKMANDTTNFL